MHAATCLSARVSTNKELASAALFLATAVCWIALASFSAPTWGKSLKRLGLSFSFSVLGCCGGWWLFVGAGMEGPFFATGPVAQWMWRWLCSQRVRPWIWLQPMVGGSTPPWSVFTLGLRCFLGKFCGLEVASDLL